LKETGKFLMPCFNRLIKAGLIAAASLALTSCSGGGGGGSGGTGPVTSTLSFPLQSGLRASVTYSSSISFTISGYCNGTENIVTSSPVTATFKGGSALSATNTSTTDFTDCIPAHTVDTSTDFFDSYHDPLGSIGSTGDYAVYILPLAIPVSVKVGDAGTIGTKNNYTDSTKSTFTGQDTISYEIEPDTANTAIVNMIDRSYDSSGNLTSTEQDRSRIMFDGTLIPVSADIRDANDPTRYFVLQATPDTVPPVVITTSPSNNSAAILANSTVAATFSEAINPTTVLAATFTMMDGTTPVSGTVIYSGHTATFTPAVFLTPNTVYTANISTEVKDWAGNALSSNYSWTFTTLNLSPLPPLSQSVAYQNDYAHSGFVTFGTSLTFPASPTWSATLDGAASYPLIAGGKVFVTTAGLGGGFGNELYALDEQTGNVAWGPIAIPGTFSVSGLAYDHGKIFVVNFDGLLKSFDAMTGQAGWSTQLQNENQVSSPPTAVNGIVYVGGSAAGFFAIDESNGHVLWTSGVTVTHNAPTVSSDGVFLSLSCDVAKLDPFTGVLLWGYSGAIPGTCTGGGNKTPAYANGLLYVRDWNISSGLILDATAGTPTSTFNTTTFSTPIPAFTTQTGFFQSAGLLQGIDLTTHNVLWSFTGDGNLVSAPIVIDQVVIVGSSSGTVYALNAVTGAELWSGVAGAAIAGPDEYGLSQPLTGFGAGEGYLVVPAGKVLSAWKLGP